MYRAVSNPAYICQTEEDPILKAFELSVELDRVASFDKEFYFDYKALSRVSKASSSSDLSVGLIDDETRWVGEIDYSIYRRFALLTILRAGTEILRSGDKGGIAIRRGLDRLRPQTRGSRVRVETDRRLRS